MKTKAERFRGLPRETLVRQRDKMSTERMAEAAGVSVSLVRKVLREHGIRGRHGNARLTEDKVRQIRRRHELGWSQMQLSHQYGVHLTTINRVVNGLEWKWVK